MTQLSSQV